jgi:hypothetical protein
MAGKENIDPRQIDFLKYYLDRNSPTFSDAKNSAIKAGYTLKYADNITTLMPDWLGDAIGQRKRMLVKAEKRLEKSLDSKDEKVAQDTAKFVAKTLGKNEGYSERTELTGKDGKDLPTPILNGLDVPNNNSTP